MLKFYRKLDLINRIYVFNYFDPRLLETSCLTEVPQDVDALRVPAKEYFNIHDQQLLVGCLSTKRIQGIIDKLLLSILMQVPQLPLHSRLLAKLAKYFAKKDIIKLAQSKSSNSRSGADWLMPYLEQHTIHEISYHLLAAYFASLQESTGNNILERFTPSYTLDHKLVNQLLDLPLQEIMAATIAVYLPYLNTAFAD